MIEEDTIINMRFNDAAVKIINLRNQSHGQFRPERRLVAVHVALIIKQDYKLCSIRSLWSTRLSLLSLSFSRSLFR